MSEPQTPRPLPDRPPAAPTAEAQRRSQDWQRLAALAEKEVPTSVDAWRGGLSGLVSTAAAGLLLIKLPDAASIDPAWRIAVVAIAVVATVAGLTSLWTALTATAGHPATISRAEFERRYESFDDFSVQRRSGSVARLAVARGAAVVSVVALLIGASLLWLAPPKATTPYLKVRTSAATVCGTVASGDHGEVRLDVAGERDPHVVRYADIQNLWVVSSC
ncbi:hypothetical protein [Propionicicella superfundia]|uniref:hypothetical protein n=1 Tax=Propionicicella superfundia TaxID=348582 RepID=UPI00040088EE|nr:hypothetical protein [Propionicicella superfundia]